MKVYLDDVRSLPPGWDPADWHVVRTAEEAIELLKTGKVKEISFDHDLGENKMTGYDVIKWIEKSVAEGYFVPPGVMRIHTANPGARPAMGQGIEAIKRIYREKQK